MQPSEDQHQESPLLPAYYYQIYSHLGQYLCKSGGLTWPYALSYPHLEGHYDLLRQQSSRRVVEKKKSFLIDDILASDKEEEEKEEEDEEVTKDDLLADNFPWLQCTRYKPPKLPRSPKKEGAGSKKRKLGRNPRVPFTQHQVSTLEQKFRKTHYLSSLDVAELSAGLSLTETRVKIWFQNRRARERREREHLRPTNITQGSPPHVTTGESWPTSDDVDSDLKFGDCKSFYNPERQATPTSLPSTALLADLNAQWIPAPATTSNSAEFARP